MVDIKKANAFRCQSLKIIFKKHYSTPTPTRTNQKVLWGFSQQCPNWIYSCWHTEHKDKLQGREAPEFNSNQSLTANEATAGEWVQKVQCFCSTPLFHRDAPSVWSFKHPKKTQQLEKFESFFIDFHSDKSRKVAVLEWKRLRQSFMWRQWQNSTMATITNKHAGLNGSRVKKLASTKLFSAKFC